MSSSENKIETALLLKEVCRPDEDKKMRGNTNHAGRKRRAAVGFDAQISTILFALELNSLPDF
jgi:hypothetical protein